MENNEFVSAIVSASATFLIMQLVFSYLAWLYWDKDAGIKKSIEGIYDFASVNSYFVVICRGVQLLAEKVISTARPAVVVVILIVLVGVNTITLTFASASIEPSELADFVKNAQMIDGETGSLVKYPPTANSSSIVANLSVGTCVLAVFEISILSVYSLLFTMAVVLTAAVVRSRITLLMVLVADVLVCVLLSLVGLFLMHSWYLQDPFARLAVSLAAMSPVVAMLFLAVVAVYLPEKLEGSHRWSRPVLPKSVLVSSFACALFLLLVALFGMHLARSSPTFYHGASSIVFSLLLFGVVAIWMPNLVRIGGDRFAHTFPALVVVGSLAWSLWELHLNASGVLIFLRLLGSTSAALKVGGLLGLTSSVATAAHLLAIGVGVILKAAPDCFRRLVDRHLVALVIDEEKTMKRLGMVVGGLAALLAALIRIL